MQEHVLRLEVSVHNLQFLDVIDAVDQLSVDAAHKGCERSGSQTPSVDPEPFAETEKAATRPEYARVEM